MPAGLVSVLFAVFFSRLAEKSPVLNLPPVSVFFARTGPLFSEVPVPEVSDIPQGRVGLPAGPLEPGHYGFHR